MERSESQWLTVEEVADELRVSPETVRRWIRAGDLPVLDLGSTKSGYRIHRNDLDQYIEGRHGRMGKLAA